MPAMTMTPTAEALTSEVQQLQSELNKTRDTLRLYAAVVENFPGGIILTDQNLNVVVCNKQQKKLLNYSSELFEGHIPSLYELFQYNAERGEYGPGRPEDYVAEKIEMVQKRIAHVFERVRPDGTVIEVRGMPIEGGGFVTSYVDITERRKSEALIQRLAYTDALTSLSNRAGLQRDYQHFAARARRGEQFALHYIDLDNFKPVNDRHGHLIGDRLLEDVAMRLKATSRETDMVSRYGGDEFVVLQANVADMEEAKSLAERITCALKEPFYFGDILVNLSCSVGVVIPTDRSNEASLNALISAADAGMYKSKSNGKGRYHILELSLQNA
jgi:diguanylate cyclase (GGDEF)-like protein